MIDISHLRSQTPLTALDVAHLSSKHIRLLVKHDYLNHPTIQGNKLWKLKQPLSAFDPGIHKKIISLGGAYSNHLAALSEVCEVFGIPFIAIVRGEAPARQGYTLKRLKSNIYTKVYFLDRESFRTYRANQDTSLLPVQSDDALIIPEGGSVHDGLTGFELFWRDVSLQTDLSAITHVVLPVGTGGTAAGALLYLPEHIRIVAIPVLKHTKVKEDIVKLAKNRSQNLVVIDKYHFGGYARVRPALIDFIETFYDEHSIPLDPIYNGKSFYGVFDLIKQGYFPSGSVVLTVHTGGLQGLKGFQQKTGLLQSVGV